MNNIPNAIPNDFNIKTPVFVTVLYQSQELFSSLSFISLYLNEFIILNLSYMALYFVNILGFFDLSNMSSWKNLKF